MPIDLTEAIADLAFCLRSGGCLENPIDDCPPISKEVLESHAMLLLVRSQGNPVQESSR